MSCLSFGLSAYPHGTTPTGPFFLFVCPESFIFIKTGEWRVTYLNINTHFLLYLAQFFLELETFQAKYVEKIKTHILYPITFYGNRAVV
jgi:hypothetical protein